MFWDSEGSSSCPKHVAYIFKQSAKEGKCTFKNLVGADVCLVQCDTLAWWRSTTYQWFRVVTAFLFFTTSWNVNIFEPIIETGINYISRIVAHCTNPTEDGGQFDMLVNIVKVWQPEVCMAKLVLCCQQVNVFIEQTENFLVPVARTQ